MSDAHTVWQHFDVDGVAASAFAAGDRCEEREAFGRVMTCRQCEHRMVYRTPDNQYAGYCGIRGNAQNVAPTSGRLVSVQVTVDGGLIHPAGVCCVESERCPQGKW
jgi:hypothetical protein